MATRRAASGWAVAFVVLAALAVGCKTESTWESVRDGYCVTRFHWVPSATLGLELTWLRREVAARVAFLEAKASPPAGFVVDPIRRHGVPDEVSTCVAIAARIARVKAHAAGVATRASWLRTIAPEPARWPARPPIAIDLDPSTSCRPGPVEAALVEARTALAEVDRVIEAFAADRARERALCLENGWVDVLPIDAGPREGAAGDARASDGQASETHP